MDDGSIKELLEAHDVESHNSPITQVKLGLSLLHNVVIRSCYLVKHGWALSI